MTLTKYIKKRNFNETPEPLGGEPDCEKLRFVIQKHHASRLHYDLRLEMDGVLKSWAIPKGPSTDPEIKRLAMMVEDHPYDYKNFEGVIPSGYGAGTVIIWDEGFYTIANGEGKNKKTQDDELQTGIFLGKLHVVLHGKKLNGEYALIKTNGKAENAWLFFKIKDKYMSKNDITKKDKSVVSHKTLVQVQKLNSKMYKDIQVKETIIKKTVGTENNVKKSIENIILKTKKTKIPQKIAPMLATLINEPFDNDDWQYEIKWDGYRTIALCNNTKVELKSRNDNSFNKKFYPICKAVKEWNINAVIDGEVVVLDDEGKSNFEALQNWSTEKDGGIYYYVFDIMWYNGKDLTQIPLSERRKILKKLIPENNTIRYSENFKVSGIELFEAAKKMNLEGIIAKKTDSIYSLGIRSKDWLKIKANKKQEMIIGGYTKNDNSSKTFSSLLLGVFKNKKFIYTGKVGTGFNDAQQKEMIKLFKPLIVKTSQFSETSNIKKTSRFGSHQTNATVVWMKPNLLCEVSFTEMTADGIMRHSSFKGMNIDKFAKDIENEEHEIIKENKVKQKNKLLNKSEFKKDKKDFLNSTNDIEILNITGHQIKFTNLNKIYFPNQKITKRDVLNYYYHLAPYILPYLIDRPQSMNRHPNGINGDNFYFKDVTDLAPKWIETFNYKNDTDTRVKKYLVAKDEASLLYMATLGCIEMNPWHSRIETEHYPDWCVIDLDPADNTFNQVIEAANVTNEILKSMGVTSYPKTSGSKGIHIYIPLGAKYTYDQSKEFARVVATLVQREIPNYTSLERLVKARNGKMYIDFLQNRTQATIAAPYSLRPKLGATVSMPLHWEEVKKGLKMSDFTIYNSLDRIKNEGDIFKPVLGKGINLEKVIKTFNNK